MQARWLMLAVTLCAGCATWGSEDNAWFEAPQAEPWDADSVAYRYAADLEHAETEPAPAPVAVVEEAGEASGTLGGSSVHRSHCTLRYASLHIQEHLRGSDIRKTVRRHENEIRSCYNHALRRNPSAHGRVTLGFVISPEGAVPVAAVLETEIQDSVMGLCLTAAVRRWTFAMPPNHNTAVVNYPYVFSVPTRTAGRG